MENELLNAFGQSTLLGMRYQLELESGIAGIADAIESGIADAMESATDRLG